MSSAVARPATPVLDLTGERTPVRRLLADLWQARDLLGMLARQDHRSRYRSASLGLLWSVALPLLQGVVIAVVFSRFVGADLAGSYVPYVLAGMAAWSYAQSSLVAASTAVVDRAGIAGRIYFPRLVLPAIAPTANLLGLGISLAVAELVALAFGSGLHATLLLLPVAALLAWLLAVTAGAVLTLLHVYSRDVRYIVQAGVLVLFYATPVIYSLGEPAAGRSLPRGVEPFVLANPFTGVVQLTRLAELGHAARVGVSTAVTVGWVVVLAVAAVLLYARYERVACDRL